MGILEFFRGNRAPSVPQGEDRRPGLHMRGVARQITRMFDAAKMDRLTGDWQSMPITADWIVTRNLRTLVGRSREQCANNDYGRAFLRMCRQNIVGPKGVVLKAAFKKSDGMLDSETNLAIKDAWDKWGHRNTADVSGEQSWRAIQAAAVASAAQDGEAILRIIQGKDAGPWGFSLQVIDPMRLPADYTVDTLAGGRDGFIRHGIEFNKYARPVAYHFSTVNESESEYMYGGMGYVRIPADEIIHLYFKDLVGQKRGLPWTATALFRLRHLAGMEDAALVNARVGASKMGFIQWKEGSAPNEDDMTEASLEIDAEAGAFPVLPEGAEMVEWNPQYPAGEFSPFYKTMLRGITAGLGVAYNNLSNDLEGVNFSSIRQGTLDEREHWKELQEWLIEGLCQPVFEAWMKYSLLAGRIKSKGKPLAAVMVDEYTSACSWQPRRWQWIDPTADVNAAVDSKNNLLTSPGRVIREWGGDPYEIWAEYAEDISAMKKAGIPDNYILSAMNQAFVPPIAAEGSHPNS